MNVLNVKKERPVYACRFNEGCACETLRCASCGWNPVVARERSIQIMEQMRKERMRKEARHG